MIVHLCDEYDVFKLKNNANVFDETNALFFYLKFAACDADLFFLNNNMLLLFGKNKIFRLV